MTIGFALMEKGEKMKKFKEWWKDNLVAVLYIACCVVCWLLLIGFIAMEVIAYVIYGDKPVTEIPAWALLFMFGKGGK